MYNQRAIIYLYNKLSNEGISYDRLSGILPKYYLIVNRYLIMEEEIKDLIDVLEEFKQKNQLDKITPESIDLVANIIKNGKKSIKNIMRYLNINFATLLRNVLLPYNENVCDENHNLMMHLSEFENIIEFISKMLDDDRFKVLDKYNHDLYEIVLRFAAAMTVYNDRVKKDILLGGMISRFSSMLYFNLDEYEHDYDLMLDVIGNVVRDNDTYQQYAAYCNSFGIYKNYTRELDNFEGIGLEYILCNDMLRFMFNHKKELEKEKRKCDNE